MATMKMTSKRQVTFPKSLCDELRLKSGDEIHLEKHKLKGKDVYCLMPQKPAEERPSWFGVFHAYTKGKSHDMEDIRKGIAKGRQREWEQRYGKIRS